MVNIDFCIHYKKVRQINGYESDESPKGSFDPSAY